MNQSGPFALRGNTPREDWMGRPSFGVRPVQEIDIDGYAVRFPVWIIASDWKYETVAGAKSSSGLTSVSVFTDEPGADTFRERGESDTKTNTASFDALGFLGLLDFLELRKFTHVTFDAYRWEGHVPRAIAIKELRGKIITLYGPYRP
jgi:hypothetical protein